MSTHDLAASGTAPGGATPAMPRTPEPFAIGPAAPRGLCTDCGVSRTAAPERCGHACQFIRPDYKAMEAQVHGRARDAARTDELFFGPFRRMLRAELAHPCPRRAVDRHHHPHCRAAAGDRRGGRRTDDGR